MGEKGEATVLSCRLQAVTASVMCWYSLPPWHGLYGYQLWQLFCYGRQFRLSSFPAASSNQLQCHLQERGRKKRISHSPGNHSLCAIRTLLAIDQLSDVSVPLVQYV